MNGKNTMFAISKKLCSNLTVFFMLLVAIFLLAGCGGGVRHNPSNLLANPSSKSKNGSLSVKIQWPASATTRLIPSVTKLIRVTVSLEKGDEIATKSIVRSSGDEGANFGNLPPGNVIISASAFGQVDSANNPVGSPVAMASVVLLIRESAAEYTYMTLDSAIDHIEIAESTPVLRTQSAYSLNVGANATFVATARDASGNVVLTNPQWINWKSSDETIVNFSTPANQMSALDSSQSTYRTVKALQVGQTSLVVTDIESGHNAQVNLIASQINSSNSQIITASAGGTITLPDGSSFTAEPGSVTNDQKVTASVVTTFDQQPPSSVSSLGPALSTTFADTNSSRQRLTRRNSRDESAGKLEYQVILNGLSDSEIQDALPIARIASSSDQIFIAAQGSVDPSTKTAVATLSVAELSALADEGMPLSGNTIQIGIVSNGSDAIRSAKRQEDSRAISLNFGLRLWKNNQFVSADTDSPSSNKRTLVLIHGILSNVESAYGGAVPKIMQEGGYEQVIGFNYDWLNSTVKNGSKLAELIRKTGLKSVDIEAHSMGTLVALAAAAELGSDIEIPNMVLVAGPLDGTSPGDLFRSIVTGIVNGLFDLPLDVAFHYVIDSDGLQETSPYSSTRLDIIARFNNRAQHPNVYTVAGTQSSNVAFRALRRVISPHDDWDDLMTVTTALGRGSNIQGVQEIGTFAHSHSDLVRSDDVINAIGDKVRFRNDKLLVSELPLASSQNVPGFFWGGQTTKYWYGSNDYGDEGHMFWTYTNGSSEDNWGQWRPNLPSGGRYEVKVFIPSWYATTRSAKYLVHNADGETVVTVNQYAVSNTWVSLGEFNFFEGSEGFVRLNDVTGEGYGEHKVGFDTVQWIRK